MESQKQKRSVSGWGETSQGELTILPETS